MNAILVVDLKTDEFSCVVRQPSVLGEIIKHA